MKKILIITDSYNWATFHRAKNLKKYLTDFSIEITAFMDIAKYNFNNYDVVYITNWPIYGYIKEKINKNKKYKLVTGVSSHIGRKSAKEMREFFLKFDHIGASNMFLYQEFLDAKLTVAYTPFGADSDVFKKITNINDKRMIFGWVGNKNRPVKRFDQIKKCFDELGKDYIFKYIDQSDNLSHEELCKFYNSVGTIICFSESEGTPNPIIEGAMCGRWIISTNVGNVPELTKNIREFTPIKNISDFKNEVKKTINNNNLNYFGDKILEEAKYNWTWKNRSNNFKNMF